ncbi:hypothetical protein Rsub_01350, partial [Raphidocelis subcapitata]
MASRPQQNGVGASAGAGAGGAAATRGAAPRTAPRAAPGTHTLRLAPCAARKGAVALQAAEPLYWGVPAGAGVPRFALDLSGVPAGQRHAVALDAIEALQPRSPQIGFPYGPTVKHDARRDLE